MLRVSQVPKARYKIDKLAKLTVDGIQRGLEMVSRRVKSTAVLYAPRSPDQSQLDADALRWANKLIAEKGIKPKVAKKVRETALENVAGKANPGGLERSITAEVLRKSVRIFVPPNSEAGGYAEKIHNDKGISWWNRGAGTVAKGEQADALFITRAAEDTHEENLHDLDLEIKRAQGESR